MRSAGPIALNLLPCLMAVKDVLNLNLAMSELAKLRRIFHSEADFQFALAILLHEMWPELEVRLEIPQPNRTTLDMLVMDN